MPFGHLVGAEGGRRTQLASLRAQLRHFYRLLVQAGQRLHLGHGGVEGGALLEEPNAPIDHAAAHRRRLGAARGDVALQFAGLVVRRAGLRQRPLLVCQALELLLLLAHGVGGLADLSLKIRFMGGQIAGADPGLPELAMEPLERPQLLVVFLLQRLTLARCALEFTGERLARRGRARHLAR